MTFLPANHPIVFILGIILLANVLKGWFGTWAFFKKSGRSPWITPIIIIIILFFILIKPLMQIFSASIGMLALLFVFIGIMIIAFSAMGTKPSISYDTVKNVSFIRLLIIVVIVGIVALSISQVFGEKLLNEPSVSFSDGIIDDAETKKIDFSSFFTPPILGILMLIITLGALFLFVILQ